jgi:menaquinol-cytochrome c reductase iron-sulfur subunit
VRDSTPTERNGVPRRSFFGVLIAASTSWVGAVLAIPLVRLALFPLRDESSQSGWSDLGPVENFTHSTTPISQAVNIERRDGWQVSTTDQTVYVIPGPAGQPRALSSVCPHLGCTVQWRAEKDLFICPCHGGTYAPDGARLAGPPNRGMDELPTRIENGRLAVRFQYFKQLAATKEILE